MLRSSSSTLKILGMSFKLCKHVFLCKSFHTHQAIYDFTGKKIENLDKDVHVSWGKSKRCDNFNYLNEAGVTLLKHALVTEDISI